MTNKNIFCNTPWYELHIYQDGSLGVCCQEDHKLYKEPGKFNIANTTIKKWFDSKPVRDFRLAMIENKPNSACRQCYLEESKTGYSRRFRSNQKSVIFTRQAFDQSFKQSPGFKHFEYSKEHKGSADTHPIDLHIDLGNYCNLACKMCNASASSTIASQEVKWGIEESKKYVGSDWTANAKVWKSFKKQLLDIPNLNNIHFMGGETLLTDRFEDLVDAMIEHERFDVCFSFVTNGTTFKTELLDKLSKFRRVGIEVSIETVDEHNAYQRQGTNTKKVLDNIKKYQEWCNGDSITLSIRPAPSILTIGYHVGLLQYCLDNKLLIKSNLVYEPKFMDPVNLSTDLKLRYRKKYEQFLLTLQAINTSTDYNASDPNNYQAVVKHQAEVCLAILGSPTPADSDQQIEALVRHCERWDRIYKLDAQKLYPEWNHFLTDHNYDPTPSKS